MTEDGGDVDQGHAVQVAPTDAELERAIASVPGVVSAGIDRSAATGRSRMRLRLAPGEDEEAVAWAVAATLRERFGIALDPDAIRPRTPDVTGPDDDPVRLVHNATEASAAAPTGEASPVPAPGSAAAPAPSPGAAAPVDGVPTAAQREAELAETRERLRFAAARALEGLAPAGPATPRDADDVPGLASVARIGPSEPLAAEGRTVIPRAAIVALEVQREDQRVRVNAVLSHEGRTAEGEATAVPTSHGTFRAVAEATVAALRDLADGSLLVGIDRVSVTTGEDTPTATVILSLLTRRGEERLLGASMVRDGGERAVMRATLDALNRRVTPLLLERGADLEA